jgi:hypothetical protein
VNVTLNILEPIDRNENRTASSYRSFGSVSLQTFLEIFVFTNQFVTAGACSTRYPRRDIPATECGSLRVKIRSHLETDKVGSLLHPFSRVLIVHEVWRFPRRW